MILSVLSDQAPSDLGLRKLEEKKNFIRVKYKEVTEYSNGFENQYRQGIDHIVKGNTYYGVNEFLSIGANETIEIFFSEPIKSFQIFLNLTKETQIARISFRLILLTSIHQWSKKSIQCFMDILLLKKLTSIIFRHQEK